MRPLDSNPGNAVRSSGKRYRMYRWPNIASLSLAHAGWPGGSIWRPDYCSSGVLPDFEGQSHEVNGMKEGISRASAIGSLAAAALLFAGIQRAHGDCDEASRVELPGCVKITSGGVGHKSIELTNNCLQELKVKVDRQLLGDWEYVLRYGEPGSDSGASEIRSVRCCNDYAGYRGDSGCDQNYSLDGLQYCLQQFEESNAGQTCRDYNSWVDGAQGQCVIQAFCTVHDEWGDPREYFSTIRVWWDLVNDLQNCNAVLKHQC